MSVQMPLEQKRVLILSEAFGAGHTQAAHAISVGLDSRCPNVRTKVLELGLFLHPTIGPFIIQAYKKTITAQPQLYGKLYRSRYQKPPHPFSQLALHRICYAQTAAIIKQYNPHAIVCTHPFPSIVVSRLKKHGLSVPLYTVITDYDAHGTWISSEVNQYLVSTAEVKYKLLRRGIPSERIEITGIPVHPSFMESYDKEQIRQQLTLKDMPTILVMGGGWGLQAGDLLGQYLEDWRERIQFLFVTGTNKKAYEQLARDPRYIHPNVRLFGFTKEIGKLMEVSDLLITKPGGMTCSEGLAKSIPMLFDTPIPGQEEENLHYFTMQGYGEPIVSAATIENWLHMLAHRYSEVRARRKEIRRKFEAYAPSDCCHTILQLLDMKKSLT